MKTELKAEAVKRAKYYRGMKDLSNNRDDIKYFQGRYEEVMEANDLTEEEIKGEGK